MKKLTSIVLALAVMLSLGACAGNPKAGPEPEPVQEPEEDIEVSEPEQVPEPEPEPEPEPVDINAAVFWYDFKDAFLSNVRDALDMELTKAGIRYTDYDAGNTQTIQNEQLDLALSNGANLLIVNVVDTAAIEASQNICDRAKEADIPVIFFHREVDDSVVNSYDQACFVGSRAAEVEEMQGQMAGEYIAAHYNETDLNEDGIISYIWMKDEIGCHETGEHIPFGIEFCNAFLTQAGKPELVFYDPKNTDKFVPSSFSKQTAYELMVTALSTNPMGGDAPIEAAFANADDSALGIIEALNDAGWNKGDPEKTIPVFGIDYTEEAQEAIRAGKMTGSILQSPESMAETIAALAKNVQEGRNVFDGAAEIYNVTDYANKIYVPYEIKTE